MKIYTKTGDSGETSLLGGKRVQKDDVRVALYGELDELNSFLGHAASSLDEKTDDLKKDIQKIQSLLFNLGALLADPRKKSESASGDEDILFLEEKIDFYEKELEPLKNFILPGGCESASRFHLSRTVCRRLERSMVSHKKIIGKGDLIYINRLSDFCFVAARLCNQRNDTSDTVWKKEKP